MSCPIDRASQVTEHRPRALLCLWGSPQAPLLLSQDLHPPQDLHLYTPYSYKWKKYPTTVSIVSCSHFSLKLSQIMETTWHLVSFMCMLILEKTICCSNTAHSMTQVIETKQDFYLFQTAPINWNLKNDLSQFHCLNIAFFVKFGHQKPDFKRATDI